MPRSLNSFCRRSSPSSRRAWIEIIRRRLAARMRAVALLAEGVDRNSLLYMYCKN